MVNDVKVLIECIQTMQSCVAEIELTYAGMPVLIESEHEAISQSDLESVEEIAAKKLQFATRLDEYYLRLKYSAQSIRNIAESVGVATTLEDSSKLSASFSIIEEIIERFSQSGIDVEAVLQCFDGMKRTFSLLLDTTEKAKHSVEVNRIVVSQILAQRQENYRFWQEVSADVMSSYNAGGKQKANRTQSILNVKA